MLQPNIGILSGIYIAKSNWSISLIFFL